MMPKSVWIMELNNKVFLLRLFRKYTRWFSHFQLHNSQFLSDFGFVVAPNKILLINNSWETLINYAEEVFRFGVIKRWKLSYFLPIGWQLYVHAEEIFICEGRNLWNDFLTDSRRREANASGQHTHREFAIMFSLRFIRGKAAHESLDLVNRFVGWILSCCKFERIRQVFVQLLVNCSRKGKAFGFS